MPIYTHEQVDLQSGILSKIQDGRDMWGRNAIQSIAISRNSPREPQQAVGFLGIVDYASGIISSDCQIDTILTEGTTKASPFTSVYRYGREQLRAGSETYVTTSFGLGFSAGSAATFSIGFLTSSLASYLGIFADNYEHTVGTGEESDFAVVMGDDGSGCKILVDWRGVAPDGGGQTIPVYTAGGSLIFKEDDGIPGGIQSLNFNSTINRDQILDIRSTSPIQYITTYPIDVSVDLQVFEAPYNGTNSPGLAGYQPDREIAGVFGSYWRQIQNLGVGTDPPEVANDKHNTSSDANAVTANANETFVKAIGLELQSESENVSTGSQISYSVSYSAADLQVPMPEIGAPV